MSYYIYYCRYLLISRGELLCLLLSLSIYVYLLCACVCDVISYLVFFTGIKCIIFFYVINCAYTNAVSHSFGYGMMNAEGMVRLAQNWTGLPEQHRCEIVSSDTEKSVFVQNLIALSNL